MVPSVPSTTFILPFQMCESNSSHTGEINERGVALLVLQPAAAISTFDCPSALLHTLGKCEKAMETREHVAWEYVQSYLSLVLHFLCRRK